MSCLNQNSHRQERLHHNANSTHLVSFASPCSIWVTFYKPQPFLLIFLSSSGTYDPLNRETFLPFRNCYQTLFGHQAARSHSGAVLSPIIELMHGKNLWLCGQVRNSRDESRYISEGSRDEQKVLLGLGTSLAVERLFDMGGILTVPQMRWALILSIVAPGFRQTLIIAAAFGFSAMKVITLHRI